jgi:hypothetical protein
LDIGIFKAHTVLNFEFETGLTMIDDDTDDEVMII